MNIRKIIRSKIHEEYIDSSGFLKDLSQKDANEILKGYVEAALWTEEEMLEDEATAEIDDEMSDVDKIIALKGKIDSKDFKYFAEEDVDVDSKISAYLDIKTFIQKAGDEAVKEAIEKRGLFQFGMDFWLTRNGHGVGFWDRGYSDENQKKLVQAAEDMRSKNLYVGDDLKLYFA